MLPFEDRETVLMERIRNMQSMRYSHDEGFEEVQALLWPFRGELNTQHIHDGFDRALPVYDSTGMVALHNLVNHTKGKLFPPDFPWITFGPPRSFDEQTRKDPQIRKAYQQTAERLLHEFSVSNFYDASTEWVRDTVAIGNMASAFQERSKISSSASGFRGFSFEPVDISRIWWTLDRHDTPLFCAVKYTMHGREAWEEFGDPGHIISQKLMSGRGMLERFDFWHITFPNENKLPGGIKVDSNRKWASIWLEPMSKKIVREGGFNEHPYTIQTWNRIGREWYGNGLGHLIRPDVAGLNAGRAMVLEALEADLLPPLLVEHDSVVKYDQSDAATMSVRSQRDGQRPEYLRSGANIAEADSIFRSDRQQIKDVMLGDVIGEPNTEPRSAEETVARQARSQLRASTLTEVVKKALMAVVNSSVEMMMRRGALPELAEVMDATGNNALDIRFVSPFFTLQKSTTAQNSMSFLAAVKEMAEVNPKVTQKVNYDAATDLVADLFNVPQDLLVDPEIVTEKRIADARAVAVDKQMEVAQAMGARPQAPLQSPGAPVVGV